MPSDDWIALTRDPLGIAAAVEFVASPAAGGINLFLGTTRGETSVSGQPLLALDYEAYESMAIKQLKKLVATARQRWPIQNAALLHRLGRVPVGEPSVLIAVSTPHRNESFKACHWLIDQLKIDVPIWKKEIWAEGQTRWVHPE